MYNTIEIDRKNLTLMGVEFTDLQTLENTANAIGSNMFEGFRPTRQGIILIRDYITGQLTFDQFLEEAKAYKNV